nr:hypothetical protein [Tissierella sp.]
MKRYSSKIKIIIKDKDTNLRLPAMPFWFISSLISFALMFKPLIVKSDSVDERTRFIFENLEKEMIREIINELKLYGPFELVEISKGTQTKVKISIL